MAHKIDMSNGRANAAFARTPAWHKLGRVLPDTMTGEEAITHAGLDWQVESRKVFRPNRDGLMVEVENKRAVVRCDTDKVLGMTGTTYQPVQNRQLVEFMDAVIGAGARYDAAGSLYGGGKVFVVCKVSDCYEIIPGDIVENYITIMNGHDGLTTLTAIATNTRVVCANTFQMVMDTSSGQKRVIRLRHDGTIADNIERAKEALGLVHTAAERMRIESEALVKTQLSKDQLSEFFTRQVMKLTESEENRKMTMIQIAKYMNSPTNTIKGMEGTAWQAYNAFSEFVDHAPRRIGADKRLESCWMGEGSNQKTNAFQELLALAK